MAQFFDVLGEYAFYDSVAVSWMLKAVGESLRWVCPFFWCWLAAKGGMEEEWEDVRKKLGRELAWHRGNSAATRDVEGYGVTDHGVDGEAPWGGRVVGCDVDWSEVGDVVWGGEGWVVGGKAEHFLVLQAQIFLKQRVEVVDSWLGKAGDTFLRG